MVGQNTSIIQEAAEEILGRKTRSQGGNWFDEECKIAVEERKVSRLRENTRSKVAAYKRHKIQVYRLLRKKKRDHLNQQIENLEAQNRNGNVKS